MEIFFALFAAFLLYWLICASINLSNSTLLDKRWIKIGCNIYLFLLALGVVVLIHAI